MYLWVVIATFITTLFILGTSLRPDMKQLYVEPQAQNVITKLYVQHKAAEQYVTVRNRNSSNASLSYQPGKITEDMLEQGLPYGFKQEAGVSRFTTWVYCLDKDKLSKNGAAALPKSCSEALPPEGENPDIGVGNCCAGAGVSVYLVTYGCAPAKWKDLRSGKPSGTLMNAMNTTTGYVDGMGYAISKAEFGAVDDGGMNADMGIYNHGDRKFMPLPNYIANTSTGSESFASVCGNLKGNGQESCEYCLVYMTAY